MKILKGSGAIHLMKSSEHAKVLKGTDEGELEIVVARVGVRDLDGDLFPRRLQV